MDQNLPIVTKKLLKLMKIAFHILKKNINKKKLLLDLNLFIKKGKFVAGKTLNNLLHHHTHNNNHVTALFEAKSEFSCTNTPCFTPSRTTKSIPFDIWEMMILSINDAKPAQYKPNGLKSPVIKQLRITDSPYPLLNEGGGDTHVDEAAEAFIRRFYSQLKEETS